MLLIDRLDVGTLASAGINIGIISTSSVSRRPARDRGWPFLGSDDLARTIAGSAGLQDGDAYWLAYDVAFAMAEEWLSLGVSAVLDINLGWTFQWQTGGRLAPASPAGEDRAHRAALLATDVSGAHRPAPRC